MALKIMLQISVCLYTLVTADIFTAITDLEPLLESHKRVIDDLEHYFTKEQKRLFTIKKQLDHYKKEHNKAMEDIPNYLGNPINAFTLIKRLTIDKDYIEQSIQLGTEYAKNLKITHENLTYPTEEDLNGAANAFVRLQGTYQLKPNELSAGIINGVDYGSPMSAGDCFELGRQLFIEGMFELCVFWMKEALDKYHEERNSDMYPFREVDILKFINISYYLMGNVKYALEWTKKLSETEPRHFQLRGNVTHFMEIITENEMSESQLEETKKADLDETPRKTLKSSLVRRHNYEAHCRGEMDIPMEISVRLKCWYLTKNHPFLRLAPLKMEQMYIEPDIFVFHQVISDSEIEFIKESAKPKLKRAMIHDSKTGKTVPTKSRLSKLAWLSDRDSSVIARVSQRVADMTGLTINFAEQLQVLNYGIGGHFEPHFDFAMVVLTILRGFQKPEKSFNAKIDRRIATVLFYMSDVAQGGATVFPELGITVFPEKNAALFWMNLHPSGEGDVATKHAACPVLVGSKWVCTKWLRQIGQEFIKPCNLEYQEEGTSRKIPRPILKTHRKM